MNLIDALDFIEADYEADADRSLILAELGMSAFCGGATSDDAMTEAYQVVYEREQAFIDSGDKARYEAQLAVANATVDYFESIAQENS